MSSLLMPGVLQQQANRAKSVIPTEELIAHLDATKITGLNDGDRVTLWNDLSGNGYDFTISESEAPYYVKNKHNGKPSVEFRENEWLKNQDIPVEKPWSLIAVWGVDDNQEGKYPYLFDSLTSSDRNFVYVWRNNQWIDYSGILRYSYDDLYSSMITTVEKNGGSKIYENNVLEDSGSQTPSDNTGMVLGGRYNEPRLWGTISELIVYGRILTEDEKTNINDYLVEKWGIT